MSTVVSRIRNSRPSYYYHFLTFNLNSRQYLATVNTDARNAILCEKKATPTNGNVSSFGITFCISQRTDMFVGVINTTVLITPTNMVRVFD